MQRKMVGGVGACRKLPSQTAAESACSMLQATFLSAMGLFKPDKRCSNQTKCSSTICMHLRLCVTLHIQVTAAAGASPRRPRLPPVLLHQPLPALLCGLRARQQSGCRVTGAACKERGRSSGAVLLLVSTQDDAPTVGPKTPELDARAGRLGRGSNSLQPSNSNRT